MKKIEQIIGFLLILTGIIFVINEFITLSAANLPLWDAYITKTISRLAVPYGNIYLTARDTLSPKAYLLDHAFIISGVIFLIGNLVCVRKYISKNRILFCILTIITSIGLITIAFNPTGGPTTHLPHQIGAIMIFVGATLVLILTGLSIENQPTYKKICLILGAISLVFGLLLISVYFNVNYPFRGLFERGMIYSIIVWIIITGYYLLTNKFKEKTIS